MSNPERAANDLGVHGPILLQVSRVMMLPAAWM
jgi:hypothetical protein